MVAYKCDVCGKLFEGNKFRVIKVCKWQLFSDDMDMDICPECEKAIRELMNNRKKGAINNE